MVSRVLSYRFACSASRAFISSGSEFEFEDDDFLVVLRAILKLRTGAATVAGGAVTVAGADAILDGAGEFATEEFDAE